MHKPVLLEETVSLLVTDPRGIYVDCTVGGGGHLARLAERLEAEATLVGIDKDRRALQETSARMVGAAPTVILVHGDFRYLKALLRGKGITRVHGILLDLGVSSFQLDEAERGFSYHLDAPLDMRMNSDQNRSAWNLVNELPEEELAGIIWRFGEERYSRLIAREIVKRRQVAPINTTLELVEVISKAIPSRSKRGKHPARRTFQALRIAVNDEMGALEEVLPQAVDVLGSGGRMGVITFHSLEDRAVKNFIKLESSGCLCPKHLPVCVCHHQARLRPVTVKPVVPDVHEQTANRRARSAKLRVAERI